MTNSPPKTVIILGVARSGTSLIAGILDILGVKLSPDKVLGSWNPRGEFEDPDFRNINKEIYKSVGADYYKNPPMPGQLLFQENKFKDKIQTLVRKKSMGKSIWGWKDPLTSLTIELFLPYLINPHFIIILRNPIDVAKSLVRHAKIDFCEALKLNFFYNSQIVGFLEKYPSLPKFYISFEDLINNPEKEVKRMADFLGLELTEEKMKKIESFIVPRDKIPHEKRKAALNFLLKVRIPRFIKKCIQNPTKIPSLLYQVLKNNF